MTNPKLLVLTALAIATIASLLIHQGAHAKFREREASLQEQAEQMATLTAEHKRLSNLVADITNAPAAKDHTTELAKLRSEAEALKKQTNDIARQLAATQEAQPAQPPKPVPPATPHTQEYWDQMHQMVGNRGSDARDLGAAFSAYADDHQGQSPASLDQLATYLGKNSPSWSGTNQFEIIYHGSTADLDGLPSGVVAVVREVQPWPAPDGRMMRVYGMADGVGQTVASDDNFAAWEAKHMISPPKPQTTGH